MEENKVMEGTGSKKNIVAKILVGAIFAAVGAVGALILKKRKQNEIVDSENDSEEE